jgi:hypothetical protein
MIVLEKNGYGTESSIAFTHQGLQFGIDVSGWGDIHGAEETVAFLRSWIRALNSHAAQETHHLLDVLDAAPADDKRRESLQIVALETAKLAARRAGLEASEEDANEGHECSCNVVPLPDK